MTFLRILYVDSDIKRQELVKAAIRKEHPEHDVFVSPSLPLAKSKLDYEGPFDLVILASSVDEPRSGDGFLLNKDSTHNRHYIIHNNVLLVLNALCVGPDLIIRSDLTFWS